MSATPCFIQISDTHLVADTSLESYGVNPYENLERVIARISHLDPPPAFVVFTGDLISDDDPQSYRHLKLLADRLPSPVHFGMGNHDVRRPFRRVVLGEASPGSEPHYYAFDTAGYRFIVLDSLVEGQVAGEVDATQLAWLDDTLTGGSGQPTVVFMHHPPVPTGVDWLDAQAFGNADALLDILARASGRYNGSSSDTFTCRCRSRSGAYSSAACRPAPTSSGTPSPARRCGPALPATGSYTSWRGG